jgi:large subunit ribosomal protein L25
MSEQQVVNAEIRTAAGKGVARKLRRNGRVPGIFYQSAVEPVMLSFDTLDIFHLMNAPQGLVTLKFSDGREELAVAKEYTLHPVNESIVHVDFMGVTKGEKFTVTVPVNIVGESAGVKLGGQMEQLVHELEISVLPMKLPESITIDVSDLQIGDSIQIKDIQDEDYEFSADEDTTIVQIVATRVVEEEPEEGEELTEEGVEAAEEGDTEEEE